MNAPQPGGAGDDTAPSTMGMAGLGIDGVLPDGGNEGVTPGAPADVFTLKTTSAEVDGLEFSEGGLPRLRLGLEPTRPFPFQRCSFLSSTETGIQQDSGNAESGCGPDLGAGILWNAP